ncbi:MULTISPECIES: cation:proton antiporter [Cyanophyceae]|uniref:cation:proton antiporter domain-containing protein n=2 Tax=Cyanobacteriota TaxID=1117 RepID=UPI00232FBAF5|nr:MULTISPECIES: cation:proton antiporter [Cyanophyceae]MDB9355571.1 cation:proton antiporter [Nodularia spumigena CS-587/03]MDB9303986.1 cation:proton antiporter [Nodularia spumigena CS-591/12]MDB9317689.1 cation:proton antiporter [Nodularia spumigena CS-590/01A]MDB9322239.1 cation:proton antiporter [Nodularia spumigena CS-591/07A]MDB9329649.1 cation:proton antiporter [Nodularia spumigena CS-591/04]
MTSNLLIDSPIIQFTILLTVIFTVPPIFERLRVPGLVGLLVAGVVLGQNGLKLLNTESETVSLLSDIGKVYLMFVAGLEIDLKQFRKTKNRSIVFGFLTFLLPLIAGISVGRLFNFGWNASVLIGSLLASHTLLAYPIVSRLGVVMNEAVTVTVGATIFTDTAALLVLAICVGIHGGEFSAISLVTLLGGLAIYSALVLFGFDWAGKEFFRRSGDEQSNQFLFILLALFLASVGAQIVGVEKIVGAFLAGLAVNDVVGRSPVKEKIEFIGSVLFIPCFFVDMGLLINIPAFIKTLGSIWLTVVIVLALISSKFMAAFLAKLIYRYNTAEMLTMWSLSLPQVAATLAAALVGYQTLNSAGERLISESVLNSVIVLMLVTSIMGPLITTRFAALLQTPQTDLETENPSNWWENPDSQPAETTQHPFTVAVPIYNPQTQRYLIELAALIAQHEYGQILPLAISKAHVHMDDPQLGISLAQSQKRLKMAEEISQQFNVKVSTAIRIDDDVALAISRTSREQNASLVVMGWSRTTGLRARLFGSIIDSVFWSSHCPVAVTRLVSSPKTIARIIVPIGDLRPQTISAWRFAEMLADVNKAEVVLLHVSNSNTPANLVEQFTTQLSEIVAKSQLQVNTNIQIIIDDDVAKAIVREAQAFDLAVLRSVRYRTTGGLAVSQVTTQVIDELTGSIILLGEAHL